MARKPRIHVPGGFYHAILRGNDRQDIFYTKGDRAHFLLLLQQGIEKYDCRFHAFCLMTNHIHLLIQVGDKPLSKIIQNISFRYTRYLNKKKKRIGHLFQGRYKALLIDADTYLLELVRYIHNNPVRAGIVKDALEYPWSSHKCYLGKENRSYVTTDWVLSQFGNNLFASRKQFANYVSKAKQEPRRKDFHTGGSDGRVLGDDSFLERVLGHDVSMKPPTLKKIIKIVCTHYKITESELKSPSRIRILSRARGVTGWLANEFETANLTEVSGYFNRDVATLSRIVGNIDKQVRESRDYKESLEKVKQLIMEE